jgi:large subunit ribosomal protein L9
MAKEVILLEDVPGLGGQGEVVKVRDGYARNYLLPRHLGAPVTEAARRRLEKKRQERLQELARRKAGAEAQAARLEQLSCTIPVKTGAEGKLFGSVTLGDILAALKAQDIVLEKHQLTLAEPLRELGVFKIPVKLHPEVEASLKVWVVEE